MAAPPQDLPRPQEHRLPHPGRGGPLLSSPSPQRATRGARSYHLATPGLDSSFGGAGETSHHDPKDHSVGYPRRPPEDTTTQHWKSLYDDAIADFAVTRGRYETRLREYEQKEGDWVADKKRFAAAEEKWAVEKNALLEYIEETRNKAAADRGTSGCREEQGRDPRWPRRAGEEEVAELRAQLAHAEQERALLEEAFQDRERQFSEVLRRAEGEKLEQSAQFEAKLERRLKEEARKRAAEVGTSREETRKLTQKMAEDQKLLEECRTQLSRQHHALLELQNKFRDVEAAKLQFQSQVRQQEALRQEYAAREEQLRRQFADQHAASQTTIVAMRERLQGLKAVSGESQGRGLGAAVSMASYSGDQLLSLGIRTEVAEKMKILPPQITSLVLLRIARKSFRPAVSPELQEKERQALEILRGALRTSEEYQCQVSGEETPFEVDDIVAGVRRLAERVAAPQRHTEGSRADDLRRSTRGSARPPRAVADVLGGSGGDVQMASETPLPPREGEEHPECSYPHRPRRHSNAASHSQDQPLYQDSRIQSTTKPDMSFTSTFSVPEVYGYAEGGPMTGAGASSSSSSGRGRPPAMPMHGVSGGAGAVNRSGGAAVASTYSCTPRSSRHPTSLPDFFDASPGKRRLPQPPSRARTASGASEIYAAPQLDSVSQRREDGSMRATCSTFHSVTTTTAARSPRPSPSAGPSVPAVPSLVPAGADLSDKISVVRRQFASIRKALDVHGKR